MLFDKAGKHNTEATLQAAFAFAVKHEISTVVVASTQGQTGVQAAEMGKEKGVSVIVVTHNAGFSEPGVTELKPEHRERIEAAGGRVHTGTMVFRGVGSAIRKKYGSSQEELIAAVLRLFCQGMKVCVEMAAMVSDAGLAPAGDIICIAGTGQGADTAALIQPASSNKLFDMKVREIIAKPRDF